MSESPEGRIVSIAVKTARGGPMREIEEAEAVVDGGITADLRVSAKRGITLLARDRWEDALQDLGAELPWHTRRANVLVDGLDLAALIGKRVRIGEVELQIGGETTPCSMMDKMYRGLKAALLPDCRAGVYGRVLQAGHFRVGDRVVPGE